MSSEQNKVILRAEHISKTYGEKKVLEDISIYLEQGELVSLLGVSGSGKTTLFNVLSGIIPPDEGKVYLKDQDVTSTPGSISYMLQKDLLLPHKKVIDNVALPLVLKGVKKAEAREKANPLFAEFGLEGTQYQYPSQLSGGMRQRAALLRTYLSSSGVALLDEPFSALDTLTKASVHKWYLEVMQHIDLSTLFITHDINEAILLSDRIYILNGTPGTINKVKRQINPKLRIEGILLTMVDNRTNYSKDISNLIRESYGGKLKVYKTDIPRSVRAEEISAEGHSIFQHDPKGKVADAYRVLTKEVLNNAEKRRKHQLEGVR